MSASASEGSARASRAGVLEALADSACNPTSAKMPQAANKGSQDTTKKVGDAVSGKYQLLKTIGYGAFGIVYSAKCLDPSGPTGLLAIKAALSNRDGSSNKVDKTHLIFSNRSLRREQRCLKILHDGSKASDYFIKFIDSYTDPRQGQFCLVMPQMACSLYDAVIQTRQRPPYSWEQKAYPYLKYSQFHEGFSLERTKSIARKLLRAADHMRNYKVVHTDIKPENILMTSVEGDQIKICDFGSSDTPNASFTLRQALFYRAPEATISKEADFPLDIWGIGCVLAEALTGGSLINTRVDKSKSEDELNSQHLLNIASFVGDWHHVTHLSSPVKLLIYENNAGHWKVKAGEIEALFEQSRRSWEDVLSPELLQAKQAQFWSPSKRAAVALDFKLFENFMKKLLDPNPETRYTASGALQDPWLCNDEREDTSEV